MNLKQIISVNIYLFLSFYFLIQKYFLVSLRSNTIRLKSKTVEPYSPFEIKKAISKCYLIDKKVQTKYINVYITTAKYIK